MMQSTLCNYFMTEDILDEQELASLATAESHFVTQMNRVGRYVALGSFAIGTLLVIISYLSVRRPDTIMIFGLYYVMLAVVVNSIVLLLVFISLFSAKNKRRVWATMGIMLANIPISLLYLVLVVYGH